jgi:copper homeostasis protein
MLEICVSNLQSALTAQRAAAQRIELCSALDTGGLTPSAGLLRTIRAQLRIPINVLIRPREGNFCYTDAELAIMLDDIRICREIGADGLVIGALDEKGKFDIPKMTRMVEAADGLDITCHRAFDFTADPMMALEILIAFGVPRVLSSGQSVSAFEGRFLLKKLVDRAAGRISVMPGAGLTAANIQEVADVTGAQEFHLTGRKKIRQPNTGNTLPGLEYAYWESDEAIIREVVAALHEL